MQMARAICFSQVHYSNLSFYRVIKSSDSSNKRSYKCLSHSSVWCKATQPKRTLRCVEQNQKHFLFFFVLIWSIKEPYIPTRRNCVRGISYVSSIAMLATKVKISIGYTFGVFIFCRVLLSIRCHRICFITVSFGVFISSALFEIFSSPCPLLWLQNMTKRKKERNQNVAL